MVSKLPKVVGMCFLYGPEEEEGFYKLERGTLWVA